MRRKLLYITCSFVLLLVLFGGCVNNKEVKSPFRGFKMLGDSLFLKYDALSDKGISPRENDLILLNLTYATYPKDSIVYKTTAKIKLNYGSSPNDIENALFHLSDGDSATLIVSPHHFFTNNLDTAVPNYFVDKTWMYIHIKIDNIEPYTVYINRVKKMLDWIYESVDTDMSYKTFINNLLLFEKRGGITKILLKKGVGDTISPGDTIKINYEGYFFDGKLFDSTVKTNNPMEFVYGREKQVIPAFEMMLKNMQDKEKALYIVAPEFAFGTRGVKDIVPPNVPLIFVLEVDTVKKGISL